jgi:hypothetical protein
MYYLKNTRLNQYVSTTGYSHVISGAVEFRLPALAKRFGLAINASLSNVKSRAFQVGFELIDSSPKIEKVHIDYGKLESKPGDMLLCMGEYHFDKDIINMKCVYTPKRATLRLPVGYKDEDLKYVVLKVIRIVGEIQ